MATPAVVVVSGPPCTGKTTFGSRLASDFGLPFISKDSYKEVLFDTLGWSDREWSKKLGLASVELVFGFAASLVQAGHSAVMESAFHREYDRPRLNELRGRSGCRLIEVHLTADPEVIVSRFVRRDESGKRHRGHVDAHVARSGELRRELDNGTWDSLEVSDEVVRVDTSDLNRVDYDRVVTAVRDLLEPD